jgi:hypothetical protein
MLAKVSSILGFLIFIAIMALPIQGTSVLGGDRATVGFNVMLRLYPIVLTLSIGLVVCALAASFMGNPKMKTVGMAAGVASVVATIAFVLYLEIGINVLHIGWVLSGVLLAVGNHLAERS